MSFSIKKIYISTTYILYIVLWKCDYLFINNIRYQCHYNHHHLYHYYNFHNLFTIIIIIIDVDILAFLFVFCDHHFSKIRKIYVANVNTGIQLCVPYNIKEIYCTLIYSLWKNMIYDNIINNINHNQCSLIVC